jgi:hypothetical protein
VDRMSQNKLLDSTYSNVASASRNGSDVVDNFPRLGLRGLGSSQQPTTQHHHTDPLIESLDEYEEVESWLNDFINSRRGQRATSAQLRVEEEDGGSPSSSPKARSSNPLASLESQLSSLSSTLTFARQDTLSVIDSTISSVNTTIPRLGLELRLMKDAALTLKANIDRLRQQALQPSVESNGNQQGSSSSKHAASAALERLSALSSLHSRMSSARDVLSRRDILFE